MLLLVGSADFTMLRSVLWGERATRTVQRPSAVLRFYVAVAWRKSLQIGELRKSL